MGEATSAATRREPTLSRPQVSSRRARPSVSRSNTRSWTAASHASTGRPWDQPVTNAAPACFQSTFRRVRRPSARRGYCPAQKEQLNFLATKPQC